MFQVKISIVTVVYNGQDTIEDTVKSVVSQDYDNLEYIVIDGKSSDRTLEIVERYKDNIAVLVSEPDSGIFDAMNKSLSYLTGEYVLFLNSGDKLVNKHIISDIFAEKQYDDDLIYGDTYNQTAMGYKLRIGDDIYSKNPSKRDLVFGSQGICHQSLFTRVSLLRSIRFDTRFPLGADYLTTYQVYSYGNHKISNVKRPVSIFDDRYGGFSHNKEFAIIKERCLMFGYNLTARDSMVLLFRRLKLLPKGFVRAIFPNLYARLRSRNYVQNV